MSNAGLERDLRTMPKSEDKEWKIREITNYSKETKGV